jgi:uncharacterized protein (TIGR00369 family)
MLPELDGTTEGNSMNNADESGVSERAAKMLEEGKSILSRQTFSTLLGSELVEFRPGYAEIHLEIDDRLRQQRGIVHGGVLNYLADNTLTFAGGSVLSAACATLEMKINYLRPASTGRLVARATLVSAGKRTAVTRCDIFELTDSKETLVAAAQGTIIAVG